MYKLTKKDRQILYLLDQNARISTVQLAKKIRLSQPATHHRLNNLIKKGIIKFFLTNIDYSAFGYFPYRFFCKLQGLSNEAELISYLQNHEKIPFLATCEGAYDLMFCVLAKEVHDLNDTIKEIRKRFGHYFSDRQIATIISGEFYPRDYLVGNKRREYKKMIFGKCENMKVDNKDWLILKQLAANSRISVVEISNNTKLTIDQVRYRLKNLEKTGLLNGYTIYLDNDAINQLRYKVMFTLNQLDDKLEKTFLEYCYSFENVVYSVRTFGSWDLEIDFEVDSTDDFSKILKKIKNRFATGIKDYIIVRHTNVYKYTHLPMANLE